MNITSRINRVRKDSSPLATWAIAIATLIVLLGWIGWRGADSRNVSSGQATRDSGEMKKNPKAKSVTSPLPPVPHSTAKTNGDAPKAKQWDFTSLSSTQAAQRMIALRDEFEALEQKLFAEHPELVGIEAWLKNGEAEFRQQNKDVLDKFTTFKEHEATLTEQRRFLVLCRPRAWLQIMSDNTWAPWFRDAFEISGMREAMPIWIAEMDREAGIPNATLQPSLLRLAQ